MTSTTKERIPAWKLTSVGAAVIIAIVRNSPVSARRFPGASFPKRVFDVAVSLFALTALAPIFGVIAFAIIATSRGGPFFLQQRTGLKGRPFFIYKFRTMVRDAPSLGPGVTAAGDPRVTRVGKILRATKLDELPNFINVLKGEMSVVGPRPDLPRFMTTLTAEQRRILDFRPGITGVTQIRYIAEEELLSPINIDEDYVENVFQDKIKSDLDYVNNYSFRRDLLLVIQTAAALVTKVLSRFTGTYRRHR